jgi:hypothetical protein
MSNTKLDIYFCIIKKCRPIVENTTNPKNKLSNTVNNNKRSDSISTKQTAQKSINSLAVTLLAGFIFSATRNSNI